MSNDIETWKAFYDEAERYRTAAKGGLHRPEVFTPEIVQNISAMSIEKYFMAICLGHGALPRNHTLEDLILAASPFVTIDPELEASLRYMDSLQNLCSLVPVKLTPPSKDDVPRFLEAVDLVARLAETELRGALPE